MHLIGVEPGRDFEFEEVDIRTRRGGGPLAAGDPIEIETAIEAGNIFQLGTRYSEPLGATYLDPDGKEHPIVMGCYGIGPARIVAAAVEQYADEKGIVWPTPLAPWPIHLVALGKAGDETIDAAERLYEELCEAGLEPLYDDRAGRPGEKLTDAELIGCPLRIVVGKRALAEGEVEVQERGVGRRPPRSPVGEARRRRARAARLARLRRGDERSKRRLFGIDRSGPSPSQTRRGAPLHPWTLPNLVGYLRLASIPVFLVLAFQSDDGRDTAAGLLYLWITLGDYLDGFLARATGQYSRMGALLDPIVDRTAVLAGAAVCWHFELLPRWALAGARRARGRHARARPDGAAPRGRHRGQLDRADRRLPGLRRDLLEHGLRLVDHPRGLRAWASR